MSRHSQAIRLGVSGRCLYPTKWSDWPGQAIRLGRGRHLSHVKWSGRGRDRGNYRSSQAELRNPLGENDRRTVGRPGVHAAMLAGHLRRARTAHIYSLLMLDLWLREHWAVPPENLR